MCIIICIKQLLMDRKSPLHAYDSSNLKAFNFWMSNNLSEVVPNHVSYEILRRRFMQILKVLGSQNISYKNWPLVEVNNIDISLPCPFEALLN